LGTLGGLLAVAITAALVFGLVPGGLRWARSLAAFATGAIGFDELGTSAGRLDAGKVAWLVAAAVVIRPILPPLGTDLRPFPNPVLWFADNRRGTVDRYLLLLALLGSVVLGVGAWLIAR
jgi:hypothetical protein